MVLKAFNFTSLSFGNVNLKVICLSALALNIEKQETKTILTLRKTLNEEIS